MATGSGIMEMNSTGNHQVHQKYLLHLPELMELEARTVMMTDELKTKLLKVFKERFIDLISQALHSESTVK